MHDLVIGLAGALVGVGVLAVFALWSAWRNQ